MEASFFPLRNRTFVPLYFDTGKDKPYTSTLMNFFNTRLKTGGTWGTLRDFGTHLCFPFAEYHYQVKLNLAKPSNAENQVYGQLKVSLFGNRDQLLNAPLTEE